MTAEEKRLRAALADALEGLKEMLPYCAEYFVEKWELDGYVSRAEKALERSEASKRGKSNRSRGHESEVMCVNFLKANGFPDARSTRDTGGVGGRQSGDVSFAPGVILEVKYEQTARYPAWCRQAVQEAGVGRVWCVVRRTKGVPQVAAWPCVVPRRWWLENSNVSPGWLANLRGDLGKTLGQWPAIGDDKVVVTRFGTFVEAVRLDQ